ncbi:MAG: dTDP-glucose 4,6-dehydratase [Terriglobia bacterium]
MSRVLVTGGAGFIGSALVRFLIRETAHEVINLDVLTYAGNLANVAEAEDNSRYRFVRLDLCDASAVGRVFTETAPDAVMHLAAESHVDRSIDGPADFIRTNLIGSFNLLQAARKHWEGLCDEARTRFRFHHVSTDEVFGSLGPDGAFSEISAYRPNSPYAATKAGADHLVRAWHHTYGLPVILTNCSNNYGPYQYPEKLIPLALAKALAGEALPLYGDGSQVRDWLYVDDHVAGLYAALTRGRIGESYNIGGFGECSNLELVRRLCDLLDRERPRADGCSYRGQIAFVADRPGHDFRYAIDSAKIRRQLGWQPRETLASGLEKTVYWYLANEEWCRHVLAGRYAGERLGLVPQT